MDSVKFAEALVKGPDAMEGRPVDGRTAAEAFVASTVALITVACEASMLQKNPHCERCPPAYWWM